MTTLTGKMHFCGPDQLHGFDERLTTDVYPSDFTWTPDWDRPEARLSWFHDMGSVVDAGPCLRSNNLDYDDEVVFAAKRHLFDLARGGEARPFYEFSRSMQAYKESLVSGEASFILSPDSDFFRFLTDFEGKKRKRSPRR